MHFLIDYENVHNQGMQGSEHLLPTDHVIVFYSEVCRVMEQRHLRNIQNSGCGFEICKLSVKRKNGLDFYIATKVGELFGADRCKNAVLVSNDNGFNAIREYWQECSGTKHRAVVSDSIEHGIIASSEDSPRAALIRANRKALDLASFFGAYQQNLKLQKKLQDTFAGTAFADRIKEIEALVKAGRAPKILYLNSLRRFGRKDGLEVYRILKTCAKL